MVNQLILGGDVESAQAMAETKVEIKTVVKIHMQLKFLMKKLYEQT